MAMDMEKQKKRSVNIHEYLPVLIDILKTGKDVNMLVTGSSMAPFLCHQRDTIIISKPNNIFFKGQLVFYQRENGQYVMHRIHHIKNDEFYMIGDNQTEIEGPLKKEQIFGVVNKVIRKGKVLKKGDFWWEFFEHVWIRMIPLRKIMIRLYSHF